MERGRKPRVLLVGRASPVAGEIHARLKPGCDLSWQQKLEDAEKELENPPDVALMIEAEEGELELGMPRLASLALDRGVRVIRLAREAGSFDGRWDSRVVHLPLGVRARVLTAALGALCADEGNA